MRCVHLICAAEGSPFRVMMTTGDRRMATGETGRDVGCRSGDGDMASAPAYQAAHVAGPDLRDKLLAEGKSRNVLPIIHSKSLIFGLTGVAISALIAALFLLPEPDVFGRVLCVVGIALSYWIGAGWYQNTVSLRAAVDADPESSVVQLLDQKMEQLEDAKWELNDSAARYRDLLDQHQDMIVRHNDARRLSFANRAFCKKFDISLDDAVGQKLQYDVVERVNLESGSGEVSGLHYRELVRTVQGLRWIEWDAHQVPTGDGVEVQLTGRDVTESVEAREQLERARDEAQIANRSKSRFLASMSHEIRTPMNGITGMVNLLQDDQLTKQQQTYVKCDRIVGAQSPHHH